MALSWTVKRQLFYFSIIVAIFLSIGVFAWLKITAPTCSDGRQNQKEEGVDCGGPCAKECVVNVKDLYVLWAKPLKVKDGAYDAVAMVENNNLNFSAPVARYQFKFYDDKNILVATRDGQTFITPGPKFAVFEPGIDTKFRIPVRAVLEFEKDLKWQKYKDLPLSVVVASKDYTDSPRPFLKAVLSNRSAESAVGVYAVGLVYDKEGNAIASGATNLNKIDGGKSEEIFFTWPQSFGEGADSNEILFRFRSVKNF